jgi:hypothetical protein
MLCFDNIGNLVMTLRTRQTMLRFTTSNKKIMLMLMTRLNEMYPTMDVTERFFRGGGEEGPTQSGWLSYIKSIISLPHFQPILITVIHPVLSGVNFS